MEIGLWKPVVEPMTEDTIFDMASLTNVWRLRLLSCSCMRSTSCSSMILWRSTFLRLRVNGKENVTIRELLTHYSGLPEDVSLKDEWGLAAAG